MTTVGTGGDERGRAVTALSVLFGLTLSLSAALLFAVQPMITRAVLPRLGGSPAVWTTCSLFFQAALLLGYAGAHAAGSWLGFRGQVVAFLGLFLLATWALPLAEPPGSSWVLATGADPTWPLLGWLVRRAGLPFVALATTAPMLQHWYAAAGRPDARDPYPLYVASNAGSLAALVAYPVWIERRWRLSQQSVLWLAFFILLLVFIALCAMAAAATHPDRRTDPMDHDTTDAPLRPVDLLAWVVLAMIPSSLMLGVSNYLTTDLAPVPLLWVAPLSLYLVSFMLAFGRGREPSVRLAGRALPLLMMAQGPVMIAGMVQPFWIPLHVATFFAAAVLCHGELARRRPAASRLTAFYFALATGGALGGAFNAVVAPRVFDRVAEYPLALVAACLVLGLREGADARSVLRPRVWAPPLAVGLLAAALFANVGGLPDSGLGVVATMLVAGLTLLVAMTHRREPLRFALTVGALFLASGVSGGAAGRVTYRERNFFGVVTVTEDPAARFRRLFHGSTLHGQQSLDPARRREPLTYFDRSGPVGQVFAAFDARPASDRARVAVTGLGVGALASYARPGQAWTFFEIDPAVVRIARDPRFFTFLADSRAGALDVVVDDARLAMARAEDGGFDLVILDAFSSDAIPVHLLSREALALDRRKLATGGLIVVNITNRYLDLAPVVARLAADAGLTCRVRIDVRTRAEQERTGVMGSIWAVLAAAERDLGPLARAPLWFTPAARPGDPVWTDDHASLIGHIRLGPVRAAAR